MSLPEPIEIIQEQCEAARDIRDHFGVEKAMGYLIGEKFLNVLDASERSNAYRDVIPEFVSEIKSIFEPVELAKFMNTPRRLGALGHASSEEGHRLLRAGMEESERIQEDARNLMLLEWAKELLLDDTEQ